MPVIRWVAFDAETADALAASPDLACIELQEGNALEAAIKLRQPCILILAANSPGKILMARISPKVSPKTSPDQSVALEASGFLGLSDAPALRDASPAVQKKNWWQRITKNDT